MGKFLNITNVAHANWKGKVEKVKNQTNYAWFYRSEITTYQFALSETLKNSFVGAKFTYHNGHRFKVYGYILVNFYSWELTIRIKFRTFLSPPKALRSHPAPGKHSSAVSLLEISGNWDYMIYSLLYLASDFFHWTQCFWDSLLLPTLGIHFFFVTEYSFV